ncbi:MAG: DUF3078 domain-containing protein [Bacteroidales bacterium]|nr:DUF3078 domain-containing protein [Bacteroidales bacterium]
MKKKIILSIVISLFSFSIYAQTDELEESLRQQSTDTIYGWKKGGVISINLSQSSFTNWAAGGESSFSGLGLISLYADYIKEKTIWGNSLEIGYGLLKQGSEDKARKTDDKIEFNTKYGIKANKNWYYAGLLNFRTQFSPGYNYPDDSVKISNFLAPAYLLAGIGFDYLPCDNFSLYLSPATEKLIIVNDDELADAGAFGVDPAEYDEMGNILTHGKKTQNKFGAYIRGMFKHDIMKNIFFQTKLELYANYLENPQNIDVNWENLITMTVNKYITVDFTTQLIYDDNIDIQVDSNGDGNFDTAGPRTQFKEVLLIGLSYKL